MTLIELKKSIHQRVDDLNDPELLEKVSALLEHKESVFIIPEHMKEGIRRANDDVKNGNVYTMDDFKKKYDKWLKD